MDTHEEKKQEETYNFKEFGDRLGKIMYLRDVSNHTLASQLCLSASTISGYRTGRRSPTVTDLAEISRFLNVSADYLVGLTDEY
ncbi:MAG: helix-turn-helix domain-containing protein [Lachnospiraceae bacterium]|nr:helix-turn-helix domain-containing protein [Lachnospiraceae bacterium]